MGVGNFWYIFIQRDLNMLKKWADMNLMWVNEVPSSAPGEEQQDMLKSSLAERDVGILVGIKSKMSQPCALA